MLKAKYFGNETTEPYLGSSKKHFFPDQNLLVTHEMEVFKNMEVFIDM